jgi:ABC-2 type transport system permease protein
MPSAVVTSIQRAIYRHPVMLSDGQPVKVLATGGYGFYLKWLGVAGVISLVLLVLGTLVFRRMEADFAEEL